MTIDWFVLLKCHFGVLFLWNLRNDLVNGQEPIIMSAWNGKFTASSKNMSRQQKNKSGTELTFGNLRP